MLQHILRKCAVPALFPINSSKFSQRMRFFVVVIVKRALQLQYQNMGLLQKVQKDRINKKTDLGRHSFQFGVGFSIAIFQTLNYFANPCSKCSSFIIQVHRSVLLYVRVIFSEVLVYEGSCLILLTLKTLKLTQCIYGE